MNKSDAVKIQQKEALIKKEEKTKADKLAAELIELAKQTEVKQTEIKEAAKKEQAKKVSAREKLIKTIQKKIQETNLNPADLKDAVNSYSGAKGTLGEATKAEGKYVDQVRDAIDNVDVLKGGEKPLFDPVNKASKPEKVVFGINVKALEPLAKSLESEENIKVVDRLVESTKSTTISKGNISAAMTQLDEVINNSEDALAVNEAIKLKQAFITEVKKVETLNEVQEMDQAEQKEFIENLEKQLGEEKIAIDKAITQLESLDHAQAESALQEVRKWAEENGATSEMIQQLKSEMEQMRKIQERKEDSQKAS